jgi:excisionase family DNA binding protein
MNRSPSRPAATVIQPDLLTVAETCARLRISRWTFYRLVQTRQLRTVKIGSARRVPTVAISEFIADLSSREASA